MVYYAASDALDRSVNEFAKKNTGLALLCRFSEDDDGQDPHAGVAALLDSFRRRFGTEPALP
jgi:hypothetical protein